MTAMSADDPMVPLLIEELRGLLTGEDLVDAVNLHMTRQDGWLLLHIMAVSFGRLGILLATTLSDPAELGDLNSRWPLRRRPRGHRTQPVNIHHVWSETRLSVVCNDGRPGRDDRGESCRGEQALKEGYEGLRAMRNADTYPQSWACSPRRDMRKDASVRRSG